MGWPNRSPNGGMVPGVQLAVPCLLAPAKRRSKLCPYAIPISRLPIYIPSGDMVVLNQGRLSFQTVFIILCLPQVTPAPGAPSM